MSKTTVEILQKINKETQAAATVLFDEMGAFFCFSRDRFNELRKPNTDYTEVYAGLICPVENKVELMKKLDKVYDDGRKRELETVGKIPIIEHQLYNHECFYTYDIEPVIERLKPYGITADEIQTKFSEICQKISDEADKESE